MKATLEFDLNDFDEKERHKIAVNAMDVVSAIDDIDSNLRAAYKHMNHEWVRIEDIRQALSYAKEGSDSEIVMRFK